MLTASAHTYAQADGINIVTSYPRLSSIIRHCNKCGSLWLYDSATADHFRWFINAEYFNYA